MPGASEASAEPSSDDDRRGGAIVQYEIVTHGGVHSRLAFRGPLSLRPRGFFRLCGLGAWLTEKTPGARVTTHLRRELAERISSPTGVACTRCRPSHKRAEGTIPSHISVQMSGTPAPRRPSAIDPVEKLLLKLWDSRFDKAAIGSICKELLEVAPSNLQAVEMYLRSLRT